MDDLRDLLQRVAGDVDDAVSPPDLVRRGRRRARRQMLGSAAAVVFAIAAVTVVLPQALRGSPRPATPATEAPSPAAIDERATAAALRSGRWTTGPVSPLGRRARPRLMWTGKDVIEIGGPETNGFSTNNAAFDPGTGSWRRITAAPLDIGDGLGGGVWTGDRLFLFRGTFPSGYKGGYAARGGLLYDPTADTWTTTSATPLDVLTSPVVIMRGDRVLVAGVHDGRVEAALYDPASDTWQRVDPPVADGHQVEQLAMLDTPAGALLWSHWSHLIPRNAHNNSGLRSGIDVVRLTHQWRDVTGDWPQDWTVWQPQLAGDRVLLQNGGIWCGQLCIPPYSVERPELLDPGTLQRSQLPIGPLDSVGPSRIWTGAAELDLNLGVRTSGGPAGTLSGGELAVRDPGDNSWTRLPSAPAHDPADAVGNPVWAGTALFLLGGDGRALIFGAP